VAPRSVAEQAVGATVAVLCEAAELPGLLDVHAMIPPTGQALVRPVPGHNLWLWYDLPDEQHVLPDEQHVRLLTVTRTPPNPVD
jgi:hypothetical protein